MKTAKFPENFRNKIICGDVIEVMIKIPDETMDLIITTATLDPDSK